MCYRNFPRRLFRRDGDESTCIWLVTCGFAIGLASVGDGGNVRVKYAGATIATYTTAFVLCTPGVDDASYHDTTLPQKRINNNRFGNVEVEF